LEVCVQLFKLDLIAYRRFLRASAQLHGKLIALVGPNEAGKSSLLDALIHLNDEGAFDSRELLT
jgi:predicted ATP-dependent endonuclease of OLD family